MSSHHVCPTGRWSGRGPNLQQVPKQLSEGAIGELVALSGMSRQDVVRLLAKHLKVKGEI